MANTTNRTEPRSATLAYIRTLMNERLLSREEERALITAWRDRQDEKARAKVITAHGKLAVAVAQKFRHYGIPVIDLIQEGQIGLLEALNRFDPTRELRFSTYALWWVRASIQDYILRNFSIVRMGTTATQKSLFFNLRKLRARIESATNAPVAKTDVHAGIGATLHARAQDVAEMESQLVGRDASLNQPLGPDQPDEWIGLLRDERPNAEDIVIGMRDAQARSQWLQEALGQLSDRERQIIRHRHLTEHAKTLEELGIRLGVSKERVRQLETRAIEKMRDSMEPKFLAHQGEQIRIHAA